MMTRPRRTGTFLILGLLLAAMTTGSLSLCDAFIFGTPPSDAPTLGVSVHAGDTRLGFAEAVGVYATYGICPPRSLPAGAYLRLNRDFTHLTPTFSVDLVTSPSTPPGSYTMTYVKTSPSFLFAEPHSG